MKAKIYFDDTCSFCNRWVTLIMDWDKKQIFDYQPLSKTDIQALISNSPFQNKEEELKNTLIYEKNHSLLSKSDAILQLLQDLGGIASLAIVFKIVPRPIRDGIYSLIATHRHKL